MLRRCDGSSCRLASSHRSFASTTICRPEPLRCSAAAIAIGAFLSGVYVEYLLGPLLVYLADTGTTLLRRIRRGEPWYRPHRQHVYQRLTDLGLSHLGSAAVVTAATAAVSALSIWSLDLSRPAAAATGAGAVAILGLYLSLPTLLTRLRPARARGESA